MLLGRQLRRARPLYTALQSWLQSSTHESAASHFGAAVGVGLAVAAWKLQNDAEADAVPLESAQPLDSYTPWWHRLAFFSVESRKRMFFKYEKRIRSLSTPEKVFEYFSSIERDGVKYMTAVDLLRALVPVYPPEGSSMERGGALLGEKLPKVEHTTFLQVFDMDGDNLISFYEYLMVLTLLSIPLKHIEVVFDIVDIDNNGVVDREEFDIVLNHIKKQSRQANMSRGGLRTGLKAGDQGQSSGLLVKFFGKDGNEKLKLPEFKAFLTDLHSKLLVLEFMHYDYGNRDCIGGRDFARSLCATADLYSIDSYLQKVYTPGIEVVSDMDAELAALEVKQDEFLRFYKLVDQIPALETALRFVDSTHGPPSPQSFHKAVKKLTGVELTPAMTQIVFHLFGDANGGLNVDDFVHVLESRSQ